MKKILKAALATMITASLVGCSPAKKDNTSSSGESTKPKKML